MMKPPSLNYGMMFTRRGRMSRQCHICKQNQAVWVVGWRNSPQTHREADPDETAIWNYAKYKLKLISDIICYGWWQLASF